MMSDDSQYTEGGVGEYSLYSLLANVLHVRVATILAEPNDLYSSDDFNAVRVSALFTILFQLLSFDFFMRAFFVKK